MLSSTISNDSSIYYFENDIKEIRCPKCHLIPIIAINEKKNIINLKCDNHEFNETLKEFYFKNKQFQINNCVCQKNCKEKNKDNLFYCNKCYGIFCNEHKDNHSEKEEHNFLIEITKMDYLCFEKDHNNVVCYCKTHNKNICDYCKSIIHNKDNIENFNYLTDNEINDIENYIQKKKEEFINLKKQNEEKINEFKSFNENYELIIQLSQILINTYKEKKNKLNYQIIQNARNIYNFLDINPIVNNEKIEEKKGENSKKKNKANKEYEIMY